MQKASPSTEQFRRQRSKLIRRALEDAKYWCVSPNGSVENRRGDQSWLGLFSSSTETVTEIDVHQFLVGFQLANRVTWDKARVATIINKCREGTSNEVSVDISNLARQLSGCIKSRNNGRQTSAESKIIFFANPTREVFIWDKYGSRSARFRDWRRGGGVARCALKSLYKSPDGRHDYKAYWNSCAKALEDERACPDFARALAEFRKHLRRLNGPMNDDKAIRGSSFTERRLLDKLMYHEGV